MQRSIEGQLMVMQENLLRTCHNEMQQHHNGEPGIAGLFLPCNTAAVIGHALTRVDG